MVSKHDDLLVTSAQARRDQEAAEKAKKDSEKEAEKEKKRKEAERKKLVKKLGEEAVRAQEEAVCPLLPALCP